MNAYARGLLRNLALIAGVLVLAFGAVKLVSGDDGPTFRLVADMTDASPLLPGNDVRLNGVRVGKIDTIKIVDGGARLALDLDAAALPVYKDASVSSRPVSLLGERYLDLTPGTASAGQLASGSTLSTQHTGSATDLDEVLNMLDKPTSQSLAALVTTLGIGLDGNGKNVSDAIRALAPAMRDTQKLTGVLKDQNAVLNSLVTSFEPVAAGLASGNGKDLDSLVAATEQMLGATSRNEAAFRQMLTELPATLTSARRTLTQLEGTANAAVPTLQALKPTTSTLAAFSKELKTFADSADPALRAANPVLAKAQRLIDNAAPVAAQLRLSAKDMTTTVTSLDPLTRDLGNNFTTVMEFFKGWALATNGTDGIAHYFRAGTVVTPYSLTGYVPSLDGRRPVNVTDAGADEPKGSNPLSSLVDGLLGQKRATGAGKSAARTALPGLLSASTAKDGGVTGLDEKQEQGVLGFLLGGLGN